MQLAASIQDERLCECVLHASPKTLPSIFDVLPGSQRNLHGHLYGVGNVGVVLEEIIFVFRCCNTSSQHFVMCSHRTNPKIGVDRKPFDVNHVGNRNCPALYLPKFFFVYYVKVAGFCSANDLLDVFDNLWMMDLERRWSASTIPDDFSIGVAIQIQVRYDCLAKSKAVV